MHHARVWRVKGRSWPADAGWRQRLASALTRADAVQLASATWQGGADVGRMRVGRRFGSWASGFGLRGSGPRVGLADWVWAGPFGLNPGPIFDLFFGKNAIFSISLILFFVFFS